MVWHKTENYKNIKKKEVKNKQQYNKNGIEPT